MATQTPDTTGLADSDFARDARQAATLGDVVRDYRDRLRGGDMGALPAVAGLVVLFAVFTFSSGDFLTVRNMANLIVQAGAICVLAMGLVLVLLLGEIDLAAGYTGGTSAAVAALAIVDHGQPWYIAVVAALATGGVIGLLIGGLNSYLGIPSFVVSLAFFLALQGVLLKLIGDGGSVPVQDDVLRGLAIKNVPTLWGWIGAIVIVVVYAALSANRYRVQTARDLQRPPIALVALRIVGLAVLLLGLVGMMNQNRAANVNLPALQGLPWTVPVVGFLLILWTFVLDRTAFGRFLYAVGGNPEAARRAGINVQRIKVLAFVFAGMMAAIAGILQASFTGSVYPGSGGGNTLLYAVGAAVIGGTSLFGGKGKARDAVIGGVVIATIANGLGLLANASYINYLVTGGVLLLAASVDAITRRRRSAAGV